MTSRITTARRDMRASVTNNTGRPCRMVQISPTEKPGSRALFWTSYRRSPEWSNKMSSKDQGFIITLRRGNGDFLNTEMDFIYQRTRLLVTNLPFGETRLTGFRLTTEELAAMPLSPNLLPLLMQLKLFGIPLEFLNLVIALMAYVIVYPSVFWRVSKKFSLLFTIHMFIYSAQLIWSYLSFSVLYRIQETTGYGGRPIGLGQYLAPIKPFGLYVYHPLVILGCFIVRVVATSLAPITIYAWGFNQYCVNVQNAQNRQISRQTNTNPNGEYSDFRSRSNSKARNPVYYQDRVLPYVMSVILLSIALAAALPMFYAVSLLNQHEIKPLFVTCIVIDGVYFISWLILLLVLAVTARNWNFHVTHKVHQLYALQKGIATGAIRGNENPSQLKNSILLVHRDQMYVTDDQMAKQSLLRAIQTGKFDLAQTEEVYWKQNSSPNARRLTGEEAVKNSPDLGRLLHRRPEDNQQAVSYQTVNRGQLHNSGQMSNSQVISRGNSSPPDGAHAAYGTLQRNQPYSGMSTLTRVQQENLQRSVHGQIWNSPQESYASIHKPKEQPLYQRRGSTEGQYGQIENVYANYGTYARVPQVSRVQVTPQGGTIRLNGGPQYTASQQNTLQKRSIEQQPPTQMNSVRQSPLLSERSSVGPAPSAASNQREQPYQRSVIKLSSFNNLDNKPINGGVYGSSQWSAQRAPPGQASQLLWSQKQTPTGSSQPDEQCFTPTSTLTSHESNYTPTPGSPQAATPLYGRINGSSSGFYGNIADKAPYSDRTLQKNPIEQTTVSTGNTSIRHAVKINGRDDSANFSLSSAGNTGRQSAANQNDFATSIV
ncbi:unnamed protein product [Caenorhabditis auriculariae]|uniref:Uncharacterized protein n=1 Tax=Caenorhabditis auriculariae TaxID=2777116 RepID=A0A8S1HD26_9PELO|nr:unnamed protein product [Caenorhabditis auriculariae]